MAVTRKKNPVADIYEKMLLHFGKQHWWPADSILEILVGAVLTQNTNWKNVDKALDNLKRQGLLSYEALLAIDTEVLAELIRPAGFFKLKAKRLKNLLIMIDAEYDGDLMLLQEDDLYASREKLLAVNGIGQETADSILLYGFNKPTFVVDAYTYRIFHRHGLIGEECSYTELQDQCMANLPEDGQLYNEYHALIVQTGKEFCKKKKPLCERCPLRDLL